MRRIAFIDFLFKWPPDGGARIDLKEVMERLSFYYEVLLIRPRLTEEEVIKKKSNLRFNLKELIFKEEDSLPNILRMIYDCLDEFKPDFIFLADAYFLKPYLVEAFSKLNRPILLRFYAHDAYCLRSYGVKFRDNKVCENFLFKDSFKCYRCGLRNLKEHKIIFFYYKKAKAYNPFYIKKFKSMLEHSWRIIVYNPDIKRNIPPPYRSRVEVIPAGIEAERFSLEDFSLKDKKIIGFPSRADDYVKGFSLVYQSFSSLWRRRRDFKLKVFLDIEERDDFIISQKRLNYEEMPSFYKSCSAIIVPSLWEEPFGIVVLESIASKRPVFVSNRGNLPFLVKDEDFIFQPKVKVLADKMVKFFQEPDYFYLKTISLREKILEEYSWENIIRSYYLPLFNAEKIVNSGKIPEKI